MAKSRNKLNAGTLTDYANSGFRNYVGADVMDLFDFGLKSWLPIVGNFSTSFGDGGKLPEYGVGAKLRHNNKWVGGDASFGPILDPFTPITGGNWLKELYAEARLGIPEVLWNPGGASKLNLRARNWKLPDWLTGLIDALKDILDFGKNWRDPNEKIEQYMSRVHGEDIRPAYNMGDMFNSVIGGFVDMITNGLLGWAGLGTNIWRGREEELNVGMLEKIKDFVGPYRGGEGEYGSSPVALDDSMFKPITDASGRRQFAIKMVDPSSSLRGGDLGSTYYRNMNHSQGIGSHFGQSGAGGNKLKGSKARMADGAHPAGYYWGSMDGSATAYGGWATGLPSASAWDAFIGWLLPTHEIGGLVSYGKGGMAYGPSHASGNIGLAPGGKPFAFEGGEYIINKKSARAIGKSTLDRINSYEDGGTIDPFSEAYANAQQTANVTGDNSGLVDQALITVMNDMAISMKALKLKLNHSQFI